MIRILLPSVLLAPAPALAEHVACQLTAPCTVESACLPFRTTLSFDIDRNQFAPPVDAREPPRRKLTTVFLGNIAFEAEPILLQGRRGFWAELEDGSHLFTIDADGSAIYSTLPEGRKLTGTCRVSN
jgi:hypothetical protein